MSVIGVRWSGPHAVLAELSDLAGVLALHHRLQQESLPGQRDTVAGASTVLVKFESSFHAAAAHHLLPALDLTVREQVAGAEVLIEVVYDGEDLAEVGQLTGLGADGVVAAHTGQLWTGAFGGFAPGFTYLVGENDSLSVPRRSSPRTVVPAGAVALGGAFSAVYPRQSPGGWQLLGHTTARLWDLDRESPALVRPGDTVRYVAVRESVVVRDEALAHPAASADEPTHSRSGLDVVAAGLQSLVQDLGRPGFGDLGVSVAGAADPRAARQANRLVGNQPGAAVVENLLGGLSIHAHTDQVLAVTGAATPLTVHDADQAAVRRPALNTPFALLDGETLTLGAPGAGVRSYLAVRGGLDVAPVLGSRSSDSMSGIGPKPLAPGAFLPVAATVGAHPVGAAEPGSPAEDGKKPVLLRVTLGPRDDWFGPAALSALTGQDWLVTPQSNRIGVRLQPAETALVRSREGELPSEGTVAGALQVPPNGQPVLFLADHPVTGGYPVIAVVVPEDLSLAAQLPPGATARFAVVDPTTLAPHQQPQIETAPSANASEGSQS